MPSPEVFVSYASEDRDAARKVCFALEAAGLRCWVAPRDVPPGAHYAEAIVEAIERATAVVLLLSEHANASVHVRNEVERAVAKAKAMFPLRIQNVSPSKSLELYVSAAQWIDAWEGSLDEKMTQLTVAIRALLRTRHPFFEFEEAAAGARITAVGVGGAGVRAIGKMASLGVSGLRYVVANTYAPSLRASPVSTHVQLGEAALSGGSARGDPQLGRTAAEESAPVLTEISAGSDMVFVVAGLGGGTGSGAAPVIARVAKELGCLTVGVVTTPFPFEGPRRMRVAEDAVHLLLDYVDSLIVIDDRLLIQGDAPLNSAFDASDAALWTAVRSITDLITVHGLINIDFADIRSILSEFGLASMGTAEGHGERRAIVAARGSVECPLLGDLAIHCARGVLINVTGGPDITLHEVNEVADFIHGAAAGDANIIFGAIIDEGMIDAVRVTIVAGGR